jgi:ribose 5-phosphate isomerase A
MDKERFKQMAAEKAVEEIQSGAIVGLGTGSTVYYVLLALGKKVRDGLNIIGIATSKQTETISAKQGIPLSTLAKHPVIDLTIDGADEIDANLNLIKGGGGALVREKIIAHASKRLVIVADESKLVSVLGTTFALPVEVLQFGWEATQTAINYICGKSTLRCSGEKPFLSDNGNYILDCHVEAIRQPDQIEMQLNNLPGVIENGLFVNRADKAIIGTASGVEIQETT